MRKLIVTEFITLDGVVEAPGGNETNHPHGGWQSQYPSEEAGQYKVGELMSAGALLLGRKTYDLFASYWPLQTEGPFPGRMNSLPKYVVSSSLEKADWNNTKILRDVVNDVAALKYGEGGDILVYGSATLAKALLHHDLIDELHLMLYPVTVGGGLKLFDDGGSLKKFKLGHARTLKTGVVIMEFTPEH